MDPVANLKEQEELAQELIDNDNKLIAAKVLDFPGRLSNADVHDKAVRLAELVLAKSEWDRKQGKEQCPVMVHPGSDPKSHRCKLLAGHNGRHI